MLGATTLIILDSPPPYSIDANHSLKYQNIPKEWQPGKRQIKNTVKYERKQMGLKLFIPIVMIIGEVIVMQKIQNKIP